MESPKVFKTEIWSAEVLSQLPLAPGRQSRPRDRLRRAAAARACHSVDGHSLIDAACILQLEVALLQLEVALLQLEVALAPRLTRDHQNSSCRCQERATFH
jgi:hypothetical protein